MTTLGSARIVLAILCVAWLPRAVRAQDASLRERAEASFKAGAAAYAAGDYLAAIQALDAAHQLTPLPAIAFSLAQAERRQYFVAHERPHLQRAIALFRAYATDIQSGGRRADALEALSQLEPLAALQGAQARPPDEDSDARAQPTRLMITSETPGARISLDGAEAVASPLIREVAPGKHSALVEAEGFFSAQRALIALEGALILGEMPLKERPSSLDVEAPPDADVYVDGTFAGQGRVHVDVPAGPHRLAVAAKGARVVYRSVELERGRSSTQRVELARTRQRKAALGLFIAGGTALAAGIAFGAVALHREDQAQDFLEQRGRGNVSRRALGHYQENVEDRDLFRTLGIASISGAAALFVTALLLRELDRPDAHDIQRDARGLAAEPKPAIHGVRFKPRVEPWFARDTLGLALQQRF
jgi:hypothetical protein